ncbi:MAG: hypothetical protein ACK5XN_32130, partial [Bacteroidota bacterium]
TMASRWLALSLLFRMVLQFKCESYDELLSLLIIGTAFRGVGQSVRVYQLRVGSQINGLHIKSA